MSIVGTRPSLWWFGRFLVGLGLVVSQVCPEVFLCEVALDEAVPGRLPLQVSAEIGVVFSVGVFKHIVPWRSQGLGRVEAAVDGHLLLRPCILVLLVIPRISIRN